VRHDGGSGQETDNTGRCILRGLLKQGAKAAIRPFFRPYMSRMRAMVHEELTHSLQQSVSSCTMEFTPPPYETISKSKNTDSLEFVETVTGNYFLPADAHGDIIANSIKHNQIFDQIIYDTAVQFIEEDSICLDIGANFGQMSIMFSKYIGQGRVHAFEAEPFVFEILSKNIEMNKVNVVAHQGAVYKVSNEIVYFPEIDFIEHQTLGSYGIDYADKQGRPIKTIAIDDIYFDLRVSFMKIDIQGGDLFAMIGAKNTILRNKMPIIFEYESYYEKKQKMCFQEYVDFIASIDYIFKEIPMPNNYLIVPRY
jgi:FkbM family methyltransferase